MTRYFVVVHGRRPGIYITWEKYQQQIQNYRYPEVKEFRNLEHAKNYLRAKEVKYYYDETDYWVLNNARASVLNCWKRNKTKLYIAGMFIFIIMPYLYWTQEDQQETSSLHDESRFKSN